MAGILSAFRSPLIRFRKASIGVVILLLLLFMFISADWIYGAHAPMVVQIMQIYFIMFLLTRMFLGGRPITVDGKETWFNFIFMFLLTSAILLPIAVAFTFLGEMAGILEIAPAAFSLTALGFGALHGFVKAYIEEDVFRGALPKQGGLGDIVSNIAFGMFHLAVLVTVRGLTIEQAWMPILVLIGLGLVWAKVRGGFGILGATGSHFAFNIFALGLLIPLFTGMVS